jgi:hypothetical protein
MLRGRMLEAREALREADRDGEAASFVPTSWKLVRRSSDGAESVVAERVAAFDLGPDGGVVYSDGASIFSLAPGGERRRLCRGDFVEHVAFAR